MFVLHAASLMVTVHALTFLTEFAGGDTESVELLYRHKQSPLGNSYWIHTCKNKINSLFRGGAGLESYVYIIAGSWPVLTKRNY